jgi:hypothetical protein
MEPTRVKAWRLVLATLVAAGVFVIVFPFEREVTPAWVFDVVDSRNRALPGCRMQEHWEWLAVRLQRDDSAVSDAGGRVRFSRRTVRASLAQDSPFTGPRASFLGCAPGDHPDLLDAGKVGDEITYRYVPGSQAVVKPLSQ